MSTHIQIQNNKVVNSASTQQHTSYTTNTVSEELQENYLNTITRSNYDFKNKIICILCGSVGYNGHYKLRDKLYTVFKDFGYVVIDDYSKFMTSAKQPDTHSILLYNGHGDQRYTREEKDGYRESWSIGISDTRLSKDVSEIPVSSEIMVVSDSCFGEGMINGEQLSKMKGCCVFLSSGKENGPDDNRNGYYTSDGGYLMYSMYNAFEKYELDSYGQLLLAITKEYFDDKEGNKHHPVMYIYGLNQ